MCVFVHLLSCGVSLDFLLHGKFNTERIKKWIIFIYVMYIVFVSCYYISFSRTYVQYYNESGNITTGIFKGVINYNASELNGTDFVSVFEDGLWATYERDCSVINIHMKHHKGQMIIKSLI